MRQRGRALMLTCAPANLRACKCSRSPSAWRATQRELHLSEGSRASKTGGFDATVTIDDPVLVRAITRLKAIRAPVSSLTGCALENFWNLLIEAVALLRISDVLGVAPCVLRHTTPAPTRGRSGGTWPSNVGDGGSRQHKTRDGRSRIAEFVFGPVRYGESAAGPVLPWHRQPLRSAARPFEYLVLGAGCLFCSVCSCSRTPWPCDC